MTFATPQDNLSELRNHINMQKVLLTGSSGFLGQHLIRCAPATSHIIAHYFRNFPLDFGRQLELLQADFREKPWQKVKELHPDVIIHTAAMASIDACEENEELARELNYHASRQLSGLSEEIAKSSDIYIFRCGF